MAHALPALSLLETRVVGVLVEKQHTVPDAYPMTLNALISGCNQKTSRNPAMEATESEVRSTIESLRGYNLVIETSGGRVERYAHNADRVLQVPSQSIALITSLFLRGPQTAGELRLSAGRLHRFVDISAVLGFLHELAARPAGALVVELPRLPGARENRWAHLLSGTPEIETRATESRADDAASFDDIAALKADVTRLEAEIRGLKLVVARISAQLGTPPQRDANG